jgi:hypothetical protein
MKISDFGGRKFIFSITLLTLTTILLLTTRISADDYMKIALATLAVFIGTNAYLKKEGDTKL